MHDLIIVGGGPAAMSAAVYSLGKQLDVYVIAPDLGGKAQWRQRLVGQLADEYLAGEEAVRIFSEHVQRSGRLIVDHVTNVTRDGNGFAVTTQHHGVRQAAAVIIATGASPLKVPVPGADEFLGQGLGYSVRTHAHLAAGKTTAVIGNTFRALRGAAELAQTARHVYLITPGPVPAVPMAARLARKSNVEILKDTRLIEVIGSQSIEEIVVSQAGQERRLAVDVAFIDMGLHANSGMVRALLDIYPGQFIDVDAHNATHVPGLFAAGDVTTSFGEQTLVAIGEGAKAAISAYDYVLANTESATSIARKQAAPER